MEILLSFNKCSKTYLVYRKILSNTYFKSCRVRETHFWRRRTGSLRWESDTGIRPAVWVDENPSAAWWWGSRSICERIPSALYRAHRYQASRLYLRTSCQNGGVKLASLWRYMIRIYSVFPCTRSSENEVWFTLMCITLFQTSFMTILGNAITDIYLELSGGTEWGTDGDSFFYRAHADRAGICAIEAV